MHNRLRSLLTAIGVFLTALPAFAQFELLITEAPVTLQAAVVTSSSTSTATERRTTTVTVKLTHQQILQDIVGGDTTGWSLVAVRYLPADLSQVNAEFALYAVKGSQRVPVSQNKFSALAGGSVAKYREQHIGQYVLSSAGTVTNHVNFDYRPGITVNGSPLTTTGSSGDGFATITYKTRDELNGHEVFFYSINSTKAVLRGGIRLSNGRDALINLTISIGTPSLVLASTYPGVDAWPPVPSVTVD